jgi:hypothetical protein
VYTRCADGRMIKQTWKGPQLSQKSTIREIGIICSCSDHGQPRYQIWIKCDKREMHAHIIPISRMVDFCESCSPFHVSLTIHPSAHLVYATSHFSFVTFYSDLVSWLAMIWPCSCSTKIPNMNKMRQKTNSVHKMCGRTYGQTNMKRAITLAKINHQWKQYTMRMLRS